MGVGGGGWVLPCQKWRSRCRNTNYKSLGGCGVWVRGGMGLECERDGRVIGELDLRKYTCDNRQPCAAAVCNPGGLMVIVIV